MCGRRVCVQHQCVLLSLRQKTIERQRPYRRITCGADTSSAELGFWSVLFVLAQRQGQKWVHFFGPVNGKTKVDRGESVCAISSRGTHSKMDILSGITGQCATTGSTNTSLRALKRYKILPRHGSGVITMSAPTWASAA